jgi:hypothetical protein
VEERELCLSPLVHRAFAVQIGGPEQFGRNPWPTR